MLAVQRGGARSYVPRGCTVSRGLHGGAVPAQSRESKGVTETVRELAYAGENMFGRWLLNICPVQVHIRVGAREPRIAIVYV